MKRGQTTVFAIIALLIIAIAVLTTYLTRPQPRTELPSAITLPQYAQPVQTMLQSCTQQAAEDAIILTASHAGYLNPPKEYNYPPLTTAYLYDKGQSFLPSIEKMEQEIAKAAEELLRSCTDFSKFPSINIKPKGSVTVTTTINQATTTISANYPLTITKGQATTEITTPQKIEVKANLQEMKNVLEKIIPHIAKDPSFIPLSALATTHVKSEVIPTKDKVYIYRLIDDQSSVKGLPLVFTFAVGE